MNKDKQNLNGYYCLATKELECTKCEQTKDVELFPASKQKSNGYSSWCKQCTSDSSKAYNRTKVGHISQLYNSQVSRSKRKGFGLPRYTREELEEYLFCMPKFHTMFRIWEQSDYHKNLTPSVDRIDDYVGYRFNNTQLITWAENSKKGADDRVNGINNKTNMAVVQFDKDFNFINRFHSVSEASRQTGTDKSNILRVCRGKQATAKKHIWRFEDETE